jgi:hypothetical protein
MPICRVTIAVTVIYKYCSRVYTFIILSMLATCPVSRFFYLNVKCYWIKIKIVYLLDNKCSRHGYCQDSFSNGEGKAVRKCSYKLTFKVLKNIFTDRLRVVGLHIQTQMLLQTIFHVPLVLMFGTLCYSSLFCFKLWFFVKIQGGRWLAPLPPCQWTCYEAISEEKFSDKHMAFVMKSVDWFYACIIRRHIQITRLWAGKQ